MHEFENIFLMRDGEIRPLPSLEYVDNKFKKKLNSMQK